jgi:hypothetical protein
MGNVGINLNCDKPCGGLAQSPDNPSSRTQRGSQNGRYDDECGQRQNIGNGCHRD